MAKKAVVSKRVRLKRNVWVAVAMLLIAYVGIHILSRTDGFRSLVADKVSNGTRLPVALKSCGATPLLGLHLEGLDFYGVQMPDVRIKFNLLSLFSATRPLIRQLDIEGMEVQLKRIPDSGNWEPLVLHNMGTKLGAVLGLNPAPLQNNASLPQFPAYVINEKTLLQLSRAKIVWHDEQNRELAYISEADLQVRAGTFIDRKVIQTLFKSGHIKLASGRLLRDFQLEAFRIEDSGVITILNMSERDGEYEEFATQSLWSDLSVQLNSLSEL